MSGADGACLLWGQVLTGEVERLGKLLEEKDTLIAQWRKEAHAAQEAADAASASAKESEELAIQACPLDNCLSLAHSSFHAHR